MSSEDTETNFQTEDLASALGELLDFDSPEPSGETEVSQETKQENLQNFLYNSLENPIASFVKETRQQEGKKKKKKKKEKLNSKTNSEKNLRRRNSKRALKKKSKPKLEDNGLCLSPNTDRKFQNLLQIHEQQGRETFEQEDKLDVLLKKMEDIENPQKENLPEEKPVEVKKPSKLGRMSMNARSLGKLLQQSKDANKKKKDEPTDNEPPRSPIDMNQSSFQRPSERFSLPRWASEKNVTNEVTSNNLRQSHDDSAARDNWKLNSASIHPKPKPVSPKEIHTQDSSKSMKKSSSIGKLLAPKEKKYEQYQLDEQALKKLDSKSREMEGRKLRQNDLKRSVSATTIGADESDMFEGEDNIDYWKQKANYLQTELQFTQEKVQKLMLTLRESERLMESQNSSQKVALLTKKIEDLESKVAVNTIFVKSPIGYYLELGSFESIGEIKLQFTFHDSFPFRDNFSSNNYYFVGYSDYHGISKPQFPVVINVSKKPIQDELRGILRTPNGETNIKVSVADWKQHGLEHCLQEILSTSPTETTEKIDFTSFLDSLTFEENQIWQIQEKEDKERLKKQLLHFEELMRTVKYKFGVVYVKAGQTTEDEIWANKDDLSEEFENFVSYLGTKINLFGWTGYKADLDNKATSSNGTHSIYTEWKNLKIMFHIAPWITERNKKIIGNDISTIIFLDPGAEFQPPTLVSQVLHNYIIIQPFINFDGSTQYKMAVAIKEGCPEFGPSLGNPAIFSRDGLFREFLLTKLVNSERSALECTSLSGQMSLKDRLTLTRKGHLDILVQDFKPKPIEVESEEDAIE